MKSNGTNTIKKRSSINYSYFTVRITQSRIDKGLLAIPRSLSRMFPEDNCDLNIIFDTSEKPQTKRYSSYKSRTHESRIGGMSSWFSEKDIVKDDEIVIQLIDRTNKLYRLILEKDFIDTTKKIQMSIDNSKKEKEVYDNLSNISRLMNVKIPSVVAREYNRLAHLTPYEIRPMKNQKERRGREAVPQSIRVLLKEIFNGHCQVCDFTFLKRDKQPYFEIHHIKPDYSHHPKNLLSVCANCHRQFEYSNVKHYFNTDDWLVKVGFNKNEFPVNFKNLTRSIYNYKIIHI